MLKKMAQKALRTIALGYKDLTKQQYQEIIDRLDKESVGGGSSGHKSDKKHQEEEEAKDNGKGHSH